jgi:hypothetical protein
VPVDAYGTVITTGDHTPAVAPGFNAAQLAPPLVPPVSQV